MEWQNAAVFISSTFNDMHAERDYLIKEVFPELRDWAEKRKIHLTDIDLRWGITEEESENKGTVGTCLRHIDKCRPFFLCFIGQRRGWIPNYENDINDETKTNYPSIKEMINEKSLTEIEIEHSLFSPLSRKINDEIFLCPPTKHNLFFFRQDNYVKDLNNIQKTIYTNALDLDDEKLEIVKNKIRKKEKEEMQLNKKRKLDERIYVEVHEYKGKWDENLKLSELSHYGNFADKGRLTNFECEHKPLKEIIIKQLKEQICLAFPENKEIEYKSEIDEEFDQQNLFIYNNMEHFIERSNYIQSIQNYVENDDKSVFLISSKSGYGKTILLSKFVTDFKENYPKKRLFKRFCGTSNLSLNNYLLWKSIIDEAGIDRSEKFYPDTYNELKNNIVEIFNALAKKSDSVIVIDGINQIPFGKDMLKWIPSLPKDLKIIISINENELLNNEINQTIKNKKISNLVLKALNEYEKKDLIKTYLKNYLKELDEKEINEICEFKGSENPLYLKILLAELRLIGSYDQLELKIKKFGNTPESAFNQILERLENDEKIRGKTPIVSLIFYSIANAQIGLSEKELMTIIKHKTELDEKYIKDTIRLFLRQIRPFMVNKKGKHDFFYESFKNSAKKRYSKMKT